MRKIARFPVALGTITLASGIASAGVYIESSDVELGVKPAPAPEVTKIWFDGGRMRTTDAKGDGAIFKDGKVYAIDASGKSYTVVDKAAMDRMGGQLAAARKQMEAQMANMPPEQRAMMEQMMGKMGGPAGAAKKAVQRSVTATSRTETVGDHKCTVWEIAIDGAKDSEVCAAPPGSLPGGNEMMKTMREMGEMMKSLTEGLGGLGGESVADTWADLEKIKGIPILTREFEEGKATSEMRLSVIRSETVAGSQFEIPKGFKERKMPTLGGSGEE